MSNLTNSKKFYDSKAVIQILGCIMRKPDLISGNTPYEFNEKDFTQDIHKICFGAISNLANMGSQEITTQTVMDYLSDRPQSNGIFLAAKGDKLLTDISQSADVANFPYYYDRVKKMSLLRHYTENGVDVSYIYDPDNVVDSALAQQQQDYLDATPFDELADEIEENVLKVRRTCLEGTSGQTVRISEGLEDLLERLQVEPELGAPLYGDLVNTATMGARLGKYYLRSAPSGVGKTRSMLADACMLACETLYDSNAKKWKSIGVALPTLFISTELEIDECQTLALAFLSDVNEEKILRGEMDFEEKERVQHALRQLQEAPLFIEVLPDFGVKDVENCIKRNLVANKTQHVFFDYINSSLGLLEEMARKTSGIAMREDNILFLLSTRLKELAVQFNIFIMSATQCNAAWKTDNLPDANLLKGSKAIAEKVDWGSILLNITEEDRAKIEPIANALGYKVPTAKLSIYKNRRGSLSQCYIWLDADKGTCRFNPLFATDWFYNVLEVDRTEIEVVV